jgi:predicted acylesterase/phospholipase RssA
MFERRRFTTVPLWFHLHTQTRKADFMSTAPSTSAPPFKEIALTLSGGGYRAAAFHLGTIDTLNRLNLFEDVSMLSTVSGGTFTGMMYAVDATEGRSYDQFYNGVYDLLSKTDVIKKALDGLYTVPGPTKNASLSLIRSAAQVYVDDIFGEKTLSLLRGPQQTRFKELIFNTTEFRIGNSFRFPRSQSADAVIGNRRIPVPADVAEQTRLADILAASSGFPGAFEPIRFPDDFRWPRGTSLDEIRQRLGAAFKDEQGEDISVPLMDGGIYDNQGLESIELASRRAGTQLDLIIVSDTNQRDDSVYVSPNKERRGWLTFRTVAWLVLLILLLSIGTAAAVVGQLISTLRNTGESLSDFIYNHTSDFIFLYAMPFLLAVSVAALLFWLRRLVKRKQRVDAAGATFDLWPVVRRITIPDLLDLLETRFGSLLALSSTVFLKRVRGLILSRIKEDADLRDKVLFNVLYTMRLNHPSLTDRDPEAEPSQALKNLAARAEAVETKLWVSSQDELHDLIACGQATMCFTLMKYLWQERAVDMQNQTQPVYGLYQNARTLWAELKVDPHKYAGRKGGSPPVA